MKVLITGGYGFIGSHVADRFYKEGHQIFIIDNLSTGKKENVAVKHRFYNLDVTDNKCEYIFKSNRFDVVIHLAAQGDVATSVKEPYLDSKINILGLSNMLFLSSKYGVKKFIFASSAAVYGSSPDIPLKEDYPVNPLSPYGINKYVGELYCSKWNEIYGLNTICFRFANVYGPRQGAKSEAGVISIFIERARNSKELLVYGDGTQTRDFIYVEDIADAIYKSIEKNCSGVINLSSNTETSLNELIDILKEMIQVKGVVYREKRTGDVQKSRLDNSKAISILNWCPKYSLEEGLRKTIKWHCDYSGGIKDEVAAAREHKIRKHVSLVIPYIENLVVFAVAVMLNKVTKGETGQNAIVALDYNLIYIIIMSIMYGTRQSIISIMFASIVYIIQSINMGCDMITFLYDASNLLHLAIYVLVGAIVGYTVDRKNNEVLSKDMRLQIAEERNAFMMGIYEETAAMKEEYRSQIMNSEDSFGKIYNVMKELDSLQVEDIFNATVGVVENIVKADKVAVYVVNNTGSYLRMIAKSGNLRNEVPNSYKIEDFPEIKQMIENKDIFVNRTLKDGLPIMMAPIVDMNRAVAVVAIDQIGFENLTLYTQNLFKVVVSLVSSSLSNAYRYLEATREDMYIHGTLLLNSDSLKRIILSKRNANEKFKIDFTILKIDIVDKNPEEISRIVTGRIRDVDYAGIGEDGNVYVILTNTNTADASVVLERFLKHGINASIVNG